MGKTGLAGVGPVTISPPPFVIPDAHSTAPAASVTSSSTNARRKPTPLGKRCPVRFVTVTFVVSTPLGAADGETTGADTAIVAVFVCAWRTTLPIASSRSLYEPDM